MIDKLRTKYGSDYDITGSGSKGDINDLKSFWQTTAGANQLNLGHTSQLMNFLEETETGLRQNVKSSDSSMTDQKLDTMKEEIETMYKNYETQSVFLSDDMKKKAEDDIVEKEKTLNTLKRKYFGPDGEFYKKRESLMKPIQDEIYNAVKSVAEEKQYQMVLDRASGANIIFASPKIDVSDDVLTKMGYAK